MPCKESIQCEITDNYISLTNTQLFFIENFLRKQKKSEMILHQLTLSAGKLIITITRNGSIQQINFILEKVISYLFAFKGIQPSRKTKKMYEIKRRYYSTQPLKLARPMVRSKS